MTVCSNCEHWEPLFSAEEWGARSLIDAPDQVRIEVESRQRDDWDLPSRIVDWYYWGDCSLADLNNYEQLSRDDGFRQMKPKTLALAFDGSEYMAGLRTRCNFGCVQWKEYRK